MNLCINCSSEDGKTSGDHCREEMFLVTSNNTNARLEQKSPENGLLISWLMEVGS
jgi:hypothetical protein